MNKYRYDHLTGLEGRIDLDDYLSYILKKETTAYYISLVDVNDLHYVNRRFGYEAGDELIKRVAKELQTKQEKVFRLGGDEFISIDTTPLDKIEDATTATIKIYPHDDKSSIMKLLDSNLIVKKSHKNRREADRTPRHGVKLSRVLLVVGLVVGYFAGKLI